MNVTDCLIINMDHRTDLWEELEPFRKEWETQGNTYHRISGTDYRNKTNVINELLMSNKLSIEGTGFRNSKTAFLGEFGCFNSHYNCWKYIVDNNLKSCLILEDGITFLQNDFQNITIDENLDILYVNEEMRMVNDKIEGYGTQGYILTLKGAEKLLNLNCKLFIPIDLQMRNLCNDKEINSSVMSTPIVKRNNNKISSIENNVSDQNNLNNKQIFVPIWKRIIVSLLDKNVNLDEHIRFLEID